MARRPTKAEERTFILEFINLYKSLPALWDAKCREYMNKRLKSNSYNLLLDKYREVHPEATVEDVKKKINILRTNYRREIIRRENSPEIQAKLWWWDAMSFLPKDAGIVNKSILERQPRKNVENEESNSGVSTTSEDSLNTQKTVEIGGNLEGSEVYTKYEALDPDVESIITVGYLF